MPLTLCAAFQSKPTKNKKKGICHSLGTCNVAPSSKISPSNKIKWMDILKKQNIYNSYYSYI